MISFIKSLITLLGIVGLLFILFPAYTYIGVLIYLFLLFLLIFLDDKGFKMKIKIGFLLIVICQIIQIVLLLNDFPPISFF